MERPALVKTWDSPDRSLLNYSPEKSVLDRSPSRENNPRYLKITKGIWDNPIVLLHEPQLSICD